MLILLDATALLSDPLCTGIAWRVTAHAAPAWNLRIIVPEVVVVEAIAGYRRRVAEAQVGLQRWGDKHARPLALGLAQKAAEAELEEAASSYSARLHEALNDLNATVIEPPDVAHRVLVERAAARRRPCDANGDGYRDTLNWLTLLGLASEYQDEQIVWVSDNSKDFGSDDEVGLHQDLVAELAAIGAESRVQWIRTLADVVLELATEHSPETPADLQAIQARLREQALSQFISAEVLTRAVEAPVNPRDCGLPIATRSAKIIAVGEPSDLKLDIRGAIGDGEAIARFALEAETTLQVELPPESNSEDPRFSVVSTVPIGITGHLLKPLRFSGLITLDRYARPQGGEFTRVTARNDDPGLLAWKLLANRRWMTGLDRPLVPPDVLKEWREQIGSEILRPWREQLGSAFVRQWQEQIGSEILRPWLEQMGSNLLKGWRQAGAQADRGDDVPAQDNGEEKPTSDENAESEGLGEDDDGDEPTDA